jgi:drug/metabolite transporter (DMT)-like permease
MSKINNNTLAILCILTGMSVFSIQDVLIRIISDEISAFQILFTRSIIGSSLLCLYLKYKNIPIIFSSQYPVLTIIRAIIFLLGFTLFYVALANIPFAIATSLFFY